MLGRTEGSWSGKSIGFSVKRSSSPRRLVVTEVVKPVLGVDNAIVVDAVVGITVDRGVKGNVEKSSDLENTFPDVESSNVTVDFILVTKWKGRQFLS